jgi:hypothetical protein
VSRYFLGHNQWPVVPGVQDPDSPVTDFGTILSRNS